MKIIKKGKLPKVEKAVSYRGTCPNCSCEVELSASEVVLKSDSPTRFANIIRCPTKGCEAYIKLAVYKVVS